MPLLPIMKLGHPALRRRAEDVREIDAALHDLVENMIDTMRANEGIGLAAPQVNILKRLFVIDLEVIDETLKARAYINPRVISSAGDERMEEGCLSIPGVNGDVNRPDKLTVEYTTLEGETVREEIDTLQARVFQHELDHLNGVLFIDKISLLQRKLLEPKLKKLRESTSIL